MSMLKDRQHYVHMYLDGTAGLLIPKRVYIVPEIIIGLRELRPHVATVAK